MVEIYQAGGIRMGTIGLEEVQKQMALFSKKAQVKMGLAVMKQAENQKQMTKQLILQWDVFDTGHFFDSIEKEKIRPYKWVVGDIRYPAGVFPYGKWIELGTLNEHWIHRSQISELSEKLAWFIASDREFLKVGPTPPRPVFSFAKELVAVQNRLDFQEKINEAIKETFK